MSSNPVLISGRTLDVFCLWVEDRRSRNNKCTPSGSQRKPPIAPWFALRVCVADEASEWCGFIGYGVSGEGTQVIPAGVRMCGKYTG